jgi:hypothetical protein
LETALKKVTLNEIREFFEMNLSEFRAEWMPLGDDDKDDIKMGMENGSMTY